MPLVSDLEAAVKIYFDAKARMFQDVPGFELRQAGPLRCLHRHPHWPEQDAFYALNVEPREVVEAVQAYGPHRHHMITVFMAEAAPLQSLYEEWGYRRAAEGAGQPFLRLSLDNLSLSGPAVSAHRVQSPADVRFINSLEEVMLPSHLTGGVFRYYFIEQAGKPVCTGRYVKAGRNAIYVAGMDTLPEYRRHGLATALMQQMHSDAVAEGATQSVLCSTTLGLGLYQKIGYELLTYMPGFVPKK